MGAKTQYPILENAALAVVVTARRLRHYFQNHVVRIMMDLPIKQVQKPYILGKLVK